MPSKLSFCHVTTRSLQIKASILNHPFLVSAKKQTQSQLHEETTRHQLQHAINPGWLAGGGCRRVQAHAPNILPHSQLHRQIPVCHVGDERETATSWDSMHAPCFVPFPWDNATISLFHICVLPQLSFYWWLVKPKESGVNYCLISLVLNDNCLLVSSCLFFLTLSPCRKFEEIYPPEVSDFVFITDDTYTEKQV